MAKTSRSLEEIVTLQDKAITALQQANLALQLALDALQSARREVGTPGSLFGGYIQVPAGQSNVIPWSIQDKGVWNNGAVGQAPTITGVAGVAGYNTSFGLGGTAILTEKALQTSLTQFQKFVEEYDQDSKVDGDNQPSQGCIQ